LCGQSQDEVATPNLRVVIVPPSRWFCIVVILEERGGSKSVLQIS